MSEEHEEPLCMYCGKPTYKTDLMLEGLICSEKCRREMERLRNYKSQEGGKNERET